MTTETKKVIACLGSGEGKPGDPMYDAMQEVGRLLAERGHTVATGGFGGIGMEAPCRGARSVGGHTIGYTFGTRPTNESVVERGDCRVSYPEGSTGTLYGLPFPPTIEVQYGMRLGRLLMADAFVIAATGDLGTMVEFFAILNLAVKVWKKPKRVALLCKGHTEISLESEILHDLPFQHGTAPGEIFRYFRFFRRTPAEAVAWATSETPLP